MRNKHRHKCFIFTADVSGYYTEMGIETVSAKEETTIS